MPKCHVCGGTEFVKEEGFGYCTECQTRCKGVIEQVVGDGWTENVRFESRTKIATQTTTPEDYQWTTWEGFNYALKGMVDELIELGASPNLKVIVLQLWVRYLQNLQVAFLTKGNKLPKLGPSFHPRDARAVYAIEKQCRSKKKKQDGQSEQSDVSSSRKRSKAKKALAKAQYEESLASSSFTSDGSEQSFSTFSKAVSVRRDKYMTKVAIMYDDLQKKAASRPNKKRVKCSKIIVTKISKVKLLAIIHLGLLLCKDEIQLSDLLRWIQEGHLSYFSLLHFIPPNLVLKNKDMSVFGPCHVFPSHKFVREVAGRLAIELKIDNLPIPNFPNLIRRYVKDLELPEELAEFTIKLWALYPPRMQFNPKMESEYDTVFPVEVKESTQKRMHLPNYEGRAMALLLYSMKLLFGLDGLTELKLSEFASQANKILCLGCGAISLNPEDTDLPKHKLFVWKEWVKYIEFRNALLARFHFPILANRDPEFVHLLRNHDDIIPPAPMSQSFSGHLKFLEFIEKKFAHRCPKKKDQGWVQFMGKQLEEIFSNDLNMSFGHHDVNFKPTVIPRYSYLKQLRDNKVLQDIWSRDAGGGPCDQLFNDSSRFTSVGFLLKPADYITALKKENVSVTVIKGTAFCDKNYEYMKFVKPVRVYPVKKDKLVEVKLTYTKARQEEFYQHFRYDKYKILKSSAKTRSKLTDGKPCRNKRTDLQSNSSKNITANKVAKKKPKKKKCKEGLDGYKKPCARTAKVSTRKHMKLFLPYRKVWMLYGNFTKIPEEMFSDLCKKFPWTFEWLLCLTSKMLEMKPISLYMELMTVELVHKFRKKSENRGVNAKQKQSEIQLNENRRAAVAETVW